jgi:outer membrane usher protein
VGEGGRRSTRGTLTLGSALVFADGHAAVTRPVYDSFAIVAPHASVAGTGLGVDPSSVELDGPVSYAATSDLLGPPVLPDVGSYRVRRVTVDPVDAPLGTSLSSVSFDLRPGYRRGTVVRVGSDRNVSLTGTLRNADGSPAGTVAGKLVDPLDPSEPVLLFTNKAGRFYAEGLRAGRAYRLSLDGAPGQATVAVPDDAVGLSRDFNITMAD